MENTRCRLSLPHDHIGVCILLLAGALLIIILLPKHFANFFFVGGLSAKVEFELVAGPAHAEDLEAVDFGYESRSGYWLQLAVGLHSS